MLLEIFQFCKIEQVIPGRERLGPEQVPLTDYFSSDFLSLLSKYAQRFVLDTRDVSNVIKLSLNRIILRPQNSSPLNSKLHLMGMGKSRASLLVKKHLLRPTKIIRALKGPESRQLARDTGNPRKSCIQVLW